MLTILPGVALNPHLQFPVSAIKGVCHCACALGGGGEGKGAAPPALSTSFSTPQRPPPGNLSAFFSLPQGEGCQSK